MVALGSDNSGAFRSEEDLRAMDDDIKKWYDVGNLFSKKIHFLVHFTSSFPKKSDGFSSRKVSLILLLRVFNRS